MSKNKDKIRVQFIGNQAESVAGSQTLITWGKGQTQILIECGLIQENTSVLNEYKLNTKRFDFKPKNLKYIFIQHSHLDHIGAICRAVKEGFTGQIIVPMGNSQIMKAMLLDSAKIMEKDSLYLSKKFGKNYPPIYTEDDVHKTMQFIREYKIGEKIQLDNEIAFQFYPAGHIINSAQLVLWISNNGHGIKKIAFSGDLGNTALKNEYVNEFQPIESANLFIGETTYCNSKRLCTQKDRVKDLEKIKTAVQTAMDSHGQVLIPTFALQRTQQMVTHLYNLFYEDSINGKFDIPIYLCSPLAVKISNLFTEVLKGEQKEQWRRVLNWNNLYIVKEFEEIENIINQHKKEGTTAIYVCSSGMMIAGYSIYIAKELLPSAKNIIVFAGYAAEGTLAFKIKQKNQKTVNIEGKPIPARANIISLKSMTSHIQFPEMLKYYSSGFDKVALVHGDFKDKVEFGKILQGEISRRNFSSKVVIVNKSTEITL